MVMIFSLHLVAALPAAASKVLSVDAFLMKVGHDVRWSFPQTDDRSWKPVKLHDVPAEDDSVWLRARVDTSALKRGPGRPVGLYFAAIASHEIWWDGERIGSGGVVARTGNNEVPGPIQALYQIPDRLATPGSHLLAIRTSAFNRHFSPRSGYWNVLIGDYDELRNAPRRGAWIALAALSGIVITGVFGLAMFALARRDRSFLMLATLCLTAGALLLAEQWRPLFGYTYNLHIVRLLLVAICSWLVGLNLVALTVTRFPHRLGRRVLIVSAATATASAILVPWWDAKPVLIFLICFGASLVWALFALVRKLPGSGLAVTGIAVASFTLVAQPMRFVDDSVYFALNFLFICLLCSHALEVRRDEQKRTAALLKSTRLELEAMKRHMQPHFLMNTLTAISEWIEQDPKTAVKMIEALGDELRTLSEMSALRLIPAADELRLCRSHLAIMSLRKDVTYDLDDSGFGPNLLVPPTVFHTLVENAVTHGSSDLRHVQLHLEARRVGDRTHYTFESPAAPEDDRGYVPGDGTRYIEARLSEIWGDGWVFRQGVSGEKWRVEIEVPA